MVGGGWRSPGLSLSWGKKCSCPCLSALPGPLMLGGRGRNADIGVEFCPGVEAGPPASVCPQNLLLLPQSKVLGGLILSSTVWVQ